MKISPVLVGLSCGAVALLWPVSLIAVAMMSAEHDLFASPLMAQVEKSSEEKAGDGSEASPDDYQKLLAEKASLERKLEAAKSDIWYLYEVRRINHVLARERIKSDYAGLGRDAHLLHPLEVRLIKSGTPARYGMSRAGQTDLTALGAPDVLFALIGANPPQRLRTNMVTSAEEIDPLPLDWELTETPIMGWVPGETGYTDPY